MRNKIHLWIISPFSGQVTVRRRYAGVRTGSAVYAIVADAPHFRNGAELILIILLLAAGVIYVTFARNPMSFDDLIELRFLPSRRRPREPEYFEQLKSMTCRAR